MRVRARNHDNLETWSDPDQAVWQEPQYATRVQPVLIDEPVVVTDESSVGSRVQVTRSARHISLPGIVTGLVGVFLLVVGLIAVLRGDLSGAITDPVVQVMGFDHTPLLGLIDIGAGVLLLAAATSGSRGAMTFFGTIVGVAGIVGAAEPDSLRTDLGLESSFGILWIVLGAAVVLAAALLPELERYDRVDHQVRRDVHS